MYLAPRCMCKNPTIKYFPVFQSCNKVYHSLYGLQNTDQTWPNANNNFKHIVYVDKS